MQTNAGRMRMIVGAMLCALAFAVFGMGCLVVVGGLLSDAYSLGELVAALAVYGGVGLMFLVFAVLLVVLLLRTKASIHAHGLHLTQTFFRTDRVLWHDVAHIEVPKALGRWVSCHIVLHSGRRILANRLSLRSKEGPNGTLIPHPDVQLVQSHLAAWQQRAHGSAGSR